MFFPDVKEFNKTGEFSFDAFPWVRYDCPLCEGVFGGLYSDEGRLVVSCERSDAPVMYSEEEYRLEGCERDGCVYFTVTAPCDKGIMRGLFNIKRQFLKNEYILGTALDYPSFKVRGYIEGFYGKPWRLRERLEMLSLMALFGENTHYYAPKDDPYHRDKWRELYPEKEKRGLLKIIERAKSLYIDLYYCIAPGLSMRYSSADDREALYNKTRQLYGMGIRNFGLLLDDIPSDLSYEEDKRLYGTAVKAHIELINDYFVFLSSLSPDCRLTICPTAYHGKGDEEELTSLTVNIPGQVSVFYTGSDICSKEITEKEAEYFTRNNLHKPLYWDNYPVNDAEMFMEMHIGPIIGREGQLYKHSEGLISNCMEYFNCNKFSLITVAAYLWSPETYEPERAYRQAVDFMLPPDEREAFILLSDQFRTSCLHDENSRIMGEYLSRFGVLMDTGHYDEATELLTDFSGIIDSAVRVLTSSDRVLYKELSRWIRKFSLMSEILTLALDVVKGADRKKELKRKMKKYNESATVLTAFCFREFIEGVLSYENKG